MDTPLIVEQIYATPIEEVWQALTDKNKMRVWYFPQLQAFEPVVGSQFVFTHDGSPYQKEWRVTQVVAGRKLAHSWVYQGYPGWSEVIFALVAEGDKTRLTLTHTGLASFPHDPHFARHRFEDGWHRIIGTTLKNYLGKNHN
ncbi:SRPBCC domain-containing protein [Hymenobacter sp. GOD-10R]|uniref:SRPBCC family protein n=1 Tax=Hymenobacter sp. GOD-10R TaxID=3093922 RepID=UPI002D780382|nr:SRPBCC domain-containing protein [Hymenobacter sp. GOD-10R]WRQ31201.1 SRPBCC domain-containing protein [Hymenobacter sp. GOD-10R]